jgi:hypothetical protein
MSIQTDQLISPTAPAESTDTGDFFALMPGAQPGNMPDNAALAQVSPRRLQGAHVASEVITLRRMIAGMTTEAEYAFRLYSEVMRDEHQPVPLRMAAADWVYSRVVGKAGVSREDSGGPLLILR